MFEGKAGGPIVETTLDEPVSEMIMRDLQEQADMGPSQRERARTRSPSADGFFAGS